MSTPHNPVGWFEIYVQDTARARAFYEATFQVSLQRIEGTPLEMWAFPKYDDARGVSGALVRMEGKDSGAGGTIIYFSCRDCAVEAARAAAAGGRIERERFPIGAYGFIAFIRDTEGNLIGLHSRA